MTKCPYCNKEINVDFSDRGKTIIDKELGFEIEAQIHDFNTKFDEVKAPKEWRRPNAYEGIKILDRHPELYPKQDEWYAFWCEQILETNKKKGQVAIAFRSRFSGLGLDLGRGPSCVEDGLGVLWIRDLKKVKK